MIVGPEELEKDSSKYLQEADTYLRNKYPGIFPGDCNLGNCGHNDERDAFRHAYVSGRFAQDYGPVQAKAFGTGHEIHSGIVGIKDDHELPSPSETKMDLYNNAKGIEYSKQVKTPKELADRIDKGIKDGELIVLKPIGIMGKHSVDKPYLHHEKKFQPPEKPADAADAGRTDIPLISPKAQQLAQQAEHKLQGQNQQQQLGLSDGDIRQIAGKVGTFAHENKANQLDYVHIGQNNQTGEKIVSAQLDGFKDFRQPLAQAINPETISAPTVANPTQVPQQERTSAGRTV